jgi:hypothetical protein
MTELAGSGVGFHPKGVVIEWVEFHCSQIKRTWAKASSEHGCPITGL